MKSTDVRAELVDVLQLDLVGPTGPLGQPNETLPQAPSRWYLTGFLIPTAAGDDQGFDPTSNETVDQGAEPRGLDDGDTPEPAAARRSRLPSSMGLSVLLPAAARRLTVVVRYGLYLMLPEEDSTEGTPDWQRTGHQQTVELNLEEASSGGGTLPVPASEGLDVVWSVRGVPDSDSEAALPAGTRSLSVFLVNNRHPLGDAEADMATVFQAELELCSEVPFVPRPNLRNLCSKEWDERVADLQYRDAYEFAVGHNVATTATVENGDCHAVRTCWIPRAEVEHVAPEPMAAGVALGMEELASLQDGDEAREKLGGIVSRYREWIAEQAATADGLPSWREETARELLHRAGNAASRIEAGIELLQQPDCLEAFRIANRAMAAQARRRLARQWGQPEDEVVPEWRAFQLAFLLMNLRGIALPQEHDREVVDLLFFPTGGGKTEAYLGLAAFTLVLRRLRNPGVTSAGLSVLMRYTLRLLTLDQLGRAAALICALELERQQDVTKLGEWPFEIGLWVGLAATPNRMGKKGDKYRETARQKTLDYLNQSQGRPSPIPLEECPWCGEKFQARSFQLWPNPDEPTELRVRCLNRRCDFSGSNYLPILAVDEPIYRRLPCFMIATVDKFAAMPWTGEVGGLFGRVNRHDSAGFYGPCQATSGQPLPVERLPPPDLIIQDELHLISGPLGTMVGLYETALDELATVERDGQRIRPKIIASTATVRRAESQIRALFNRKFVDVFPPPGPDRRHSFFARTHSTSESSARQYLGIAAPGRSAKVIMLRVYLALLSAAQRSFEAAGGAKNADNPADPYMTLLGYFNSLRELGGARRLIEDEVRTQLMVRSRRKRSGVEQGLFRDRTIKYEVVELTSRVSTDKVAEAKRRLEQPFTEKDHVDVAIATNMISVGLDITRLGLMVVFGQPKTSSEYIQATSRVGRNVHRPGLVVTILNVNRPRDRSYYERFTSFHESFYRSVEATSVTPFSPRALDRGLAGTLISLARQRHAPMTPPRGASAILQELPQLEPLAELLARRAEETQYNLSPEEAETLRRTVRERVIDLLHEWSRIAKEQEEVSATLQYQTELGESQRLLYEFLHPELRTLPARHSKFRANRSMRDVEPSVNLQLEKLNGSDLDNEGDGR